MYFHSYLRLNQHCVYFNSIFFTDCSKPLYLTTKVVLHCKKRERFDCVTLSFEFRVPFFLRTLIYLKPKSTMCFADSICSEFGPQFSGSIPERTLLQMQRGLYNKFLRISYQSCYYLLLQLLLLCYITYDISNQLDISLSIS